MFCSSNNGQYHLNNIQVLRITLWFHKESLIKYFVAMEWYLKIIVILSILMNINNTLRKNYNTFNSCKGKKRCQKWQPEREKQKQARTGISEPSCPEVHQVREEETKKGQIVMNKLSTWSKHLIQQAITNPQPVGFHQAVSSHWD